MEGFPATRGSAGAAGRGLGWGEEQPCASSPGFVLVCTVRSQVSLAKTGDEQLGEGEEQEFHRTLSGQGEMCRD